MEYLGDAKSTILERDIPDMISNILRAAIDPVHREMLVFRETLRHFVKKLEELRVPQLFIPPEVNSRIQDEISFLWKNVDELQFPNMTHL